ncbi:MAG: FRG domain-containing protein [Flavisolibacter sp.]|jgi:hypothetical protein|nr:FRG domain-containing protein [Flavisolibacter sp.]
MEAGYAILKLEDWDQFKAFITRFSQNWAYRGQANANWILNNAIERTDFIQFRQGIEAEFLAEFQRGARNYLAKDETPEHLIEWLALMQHHGAPTRLLDLTKSPFIAAYFAFEHCSMLEGESVAIWCINIQHLRAKAVTIFSGDFSEALEEAHNLINESLFEKIFYENNRKLVFPVEPFRMNRRYSLQQSIFVSTGTSQHPFMEQLEFLGQDLKKSVVKLEIPVKYKKQAMRELQQMNLNRASLFPDIDGYALSLRLRYDNMQTPAEIQEQNVRKLEDENYLFFP